MNYELDPYLRARADKILSPNLGPRGPDYLKSRWKRRLDRIAAGAFLIPATPITIVEGGIVYFFDGHFSWPFVDVGTENFAGTGIKYRYWKVRTMIPGAKRLDSVVAKDISLSELKSSGGDPRITGIGKLIRKTSLDELPQLFNVMQGDISFVGMRPPSPWQFESEIYPRQGEEPFKEFLELVGEGKSKIGATGLFTILGRSDLSFHDWIGLEVEYIKGANLIGDMKIIAATIPAAISRKGAK